MNTPNTSMDLDAAPDRCGADGIGQPLTIEVFFDFVCPWCLIGKRNLHVAISALPAAKYRVSGVPFFAFNGSHALSGAYPPDALFASMLRSLGS